MGGERRDTDGELFSAELDVGFVAFARGVVGLARLGIVEIGAFLGGALPGVGDGALGVLGAVAGARPEPLP